MILFAIIGVIINFIAAYFTKEGSSLNQKAVNLHMLEDVLGWVVVLIGAIIMRFTDISILDPILSIIVALFLLVNALKNFYTIIELFLEKTPKDISIEKLKEHILKLDGVLDLHHIHVWSIDGYNNYATMHVVVNKYDKSIKEKIRDELKEHAINHVTLELETKNENCSECNCTINLQEHSHHHHHH